MQMLKNLATQPLGRLFLAILGSGLVVQVYPALAGSVGSVTKVRTRLRWVTRPQWSAHRSAWTTSTSNRKSPSAITRWLTLGENAKVKVDRYVYSPEQAVVQWPLV